MITRLIKMTIIVRCSPETEGKKDMFCCSNSFKVLGKIGKVKKCRHL